MNHYRTYLFNRQADSVNPEKESFPELSIIMPCLNEVETLETCLVKAKRFLEENGIDGEVIVADNGSTDGSLEVAQIAGAKVVKVAEKGYGAALLGGIEAAKGRYFVMGDADDSYDFGNLMPFLKSLRAGNDLVMGNRFKGGIRRGAMPWLHKYLGNPVLSFLGRLFFKVPIGDFHCGLRGGSVSKICGLGLRAPGMEFASEMVVKSALAGLKISEVPTVLSPDGRTRAPHLRTWSDGWRHLRFLLLHSPRWLFLYPGLAFCFMGVLLGGFVSSGRVQIGDSLELGVHTLVVSCFLLLIGVQLVVFSVLARRHATSEGFLPKSESDIFSNYLTLERVLCFSLALFLLGLSGTFWAVNYWVGMDFGQIENPFVLNILIISLTLTSVSVQLAYAGFLDSVFAMRKSRNLIPGGSDE